MFALLSQKFRSIVKPVSPAAADTTGVSRRRVADNAVNCPSLRLLAPSRGHIDNGNVSSTTHAWGCPKNVSLISRNS
jgi:hypothetical protein